MFLIIYVLCHLKILKVVRKCHYEIFLFMITLFCGEIYINNLINNEQKKGEKNTMNYMAKGGVSGIGAIITYVTGNFTPLIYLLVFFEIADYITGIYDAWQSKTISSQIAINGFFKKVFYFFLVSVAFGFDYMIHEASLIIGFEFQYPAIFGILSICYLLSTELISILENLEKIGIIVPFVTNALKIFRDKLDPSVQKEDEND